MKRAKISLRIKNGLGTHGLGLCLANWYGESILPVIALRKWTESYFRDAPVAVKRSEPGSTLRWRNSE